MSDAQTLLTGGAGGQSDGGQGGGQGSGQGAGGAGDQGTALTWLPEEYRGNAMFKDFKDVGALAKSYQETKAFVGADKAQLLRLPQAPDAPEWADVWSKLGRPEKPEEYKLAAPDGTAPEVVTSFASTAHALGLSTKQASEVIGFYGKAVAEQNAALEQKAVADTQRVQTELKAEWGQAYEQNVHAITRLIENAGGKEALAAFNAAGGGRDPVMLRAMAKIAGELAEPSALRGGSGGGMGGALTPDQAKENIGKKKLDAEFMKAYNNRDHAGHAQALREMSTLYDAAYPNPS